MAAWFSQKIFIPPLTKCSIRMITSLAVCLKHVLLGVRTAGLGPGDCAFVGIYGDQDWAVWHFADWSCSWHKRCQRFSCYPSHGVLHSTCRLADQWVSFYIFYHCQDDFALVLMEDAEGEVLSLTEEYPSNDHFQAWICVCDSSVTNCKPLAFQFGQLRVTKCTHVWGKVFHSSNCRFLNIFDAFSSPLWFT